MLRKFEITDESMLYRGRTLRRIRKIHGGQRGGWVEHGGNLTQAGTCWIGGNAKVYGQAVVCEDAYVTDNAVVRGAARIAGNAFVLDHANVSGYASLTGDCRVCGHAVVSGNTVLPETCVIMEHARIRNGTFSNSVHVAGTALVDTRGHICGPVHIAGDADITGYGSVIIGDWPRVTLDQPLCVTGKMVISEPLAGPRSYIYLELNDIAVTVTRRCVGINYPGPTGRNAQRKWYNLDSSAPLPRFEDVAGSEHAIRTAILAARSTLLVAESTYPPHVPPPVFQRRIDLSLAPPQHED